MNPRSRRRGHRPKTISTQGLTGQRGINFIENVVLGMDSRWTPSGPNEVGIDGYIELFDPNSHEALGLTVAVQSKVVNAIAGTNPTFDYWCDVNDLEYWLRGNTPVILIVSSPDSNEGYWIWVQDYFKDWSPSGSTRVAFVKSQHRFSPESLRRLAEIAAPRQGLYLAPSRRKEILHTNLLALDGFSPRIFVASTECRSPREIWALLNESRCEPGSGWVLWEKKVILALKVCDPAVGSGHFLVGAAHRLAKHLANVRAQAQGESEPSPLYYQRALRDVIGHCLYGVDVNPMAAELCRVSLWLEAIEPGKPLSFLDHHIRVGNSLLGATPALLAKGIPDEAFTPIEGDDKEICSRFKKVNKTEKVGYRRLFAATTEPWERLGNLAASMTHLDDAPDDSIEAVRNKERMYEAMVRSGNYLDGQFLADTWCAAFVWKKTQEFNHPITEEDFRRIEHNPHACDEWMRDEIVRLSQQYQFFHWHLAFPDVFHVPLPDKEAENEQAGWNGGFDLVLGNPPWERIKIQEKEWFAERRPDIAKAANAAARKRAILAIQDDSPALWRAWQDALRASDGEASLVRSTGRFPLCGRGDTNTFSVFAEANSQLIGTHGRAGFIVPSGIATDDTTKLFFQEMVESGSIVSLYDFQSGPGLFSEIGHARFKFSLLTLAGRRKDAPAAQFAFFLRSLEELQDAERQFELSVRDISLLNPNTRTCPIFRTSHDAELTKAIYRRVPILLNESGAKAENPWGLSFLRMLDMATDSSSFRVSSQMLSDGWTLNGNIFERDGERYLPLYEAKMIHQFNHRFGDYAYKEADDEGTALPDVPDCRLQNPDYVVEPRYWVPETAVQERLRSRSGRNWLLGWRDICRSNDERTVIASVIPRRGVGDKFLLMFPAEPTGVVAICGVLDSFAFDYCARQKLGGTSLKYFTMRQLPLLTPDVLRGSAPWDVARSVSDWVASPVLELLYTSWELHDFARELNVPCPPFRWDEKRRFLLRCELDAAFFHLYLPVETNGDWRPAENETAENLARLKASFPSPRDAVAYIMDTFPIVKRKDESMWNGDYRTKRVILEIYDAMAAAARTGTPYQTRLSPPPADLAVAHPWPEEIIQVAAVTKDAFSDIDAMPDESWATPVGVAPENIALFSLIDVLRNIGEAVDPERVRLAAILVRKPVLAAAFINNAQAKQWLRLIGQEARPVRGNVVQISQFQKNGVDYPWAEAIRQLRGSGALVVGSDGKWSAGDKMPASSSQDWITGRAAIAVQLLSAIDPARVEQKLIAFNRSVEDGTARGYLGAG